MKTFFLLFSLLLTYQSYAQGQSPTNSLQDFTSDGCSSFPDGTLSNPTKWLHCCKTHDLSYWAGGSEKKRLAADEELRSCVSKITNKAFGEMIYQGVRIGGSPKLTTTWRWGYGWRHKRGYRELENSELKKVQSLKPISINTIEVTDATINYFKRKSDTGNYCVDEVLDYMDKNFGESFHIEKIIYRKRHTRSSTHYIKIKTTTVALKTDLCSERIVFDFGRINSNHCTKMTYDEIIPNRLLKVKFIGDCQKLQN